MEDYKANYKNYEFRINWTSSKPFDPENETVEVRLKTKGGEYSANFTTPKFISYMFEKNKRTGECACGTYFCMRGMIIVERINEQTVRATIDDLIKNMEVEEYFERVD